MKRARSSISTFTPTLQSVDPIDLRALSDELDLSDLMRRTVISTIDEWAETPTSLSSPTPVFAEPPPIKLPNTNTMTERAHDHPLWESPNSPVRLWSSIRRLWHAVFPEPEPEPETSSKERVLETRCVQSPEVNEAPKDSQPALPVSELFTNAPQTPSRKPRRVSDFFEQDLTETPPPSKHVSKLFMEVPQKPFGQPRQVSDFFEENPTQTGQQSYPVSKLFTEAPRNPFGQPRQVSDFFEENPTQTGQQSHPVSKLFTEAHRNPFGQPRPVSDFLEENPTQTGQQPHPVSKLLSEVPPNPFGKPRQVSDFFEENPTQPGQQSHPVSKLFSEVPQNPFQKPRQVTDFFEENPTETSEPSQPVSKLFSEVSQNPFRKPRQVTDFFEEDIKESDVDLNLPSDTELLHLCSRITTPTQQSQRRRITGDPAIDRRLAHLESLRAQIRQRRENDKDEDILRRRRRQRLIEEQRRLSSSLRVQRMANVPRNVKLPVPTRRSRLAKLKDARARGGVNSPTGIFEGANGFRA